MRSRLCLIALAVGVLSCSGKRTPNIPDPESLADAADSARVAVWEPELAKSDTTTHSAFYDSALVYIRKSAVIERDKRLYAQSISGLTPLEPMHLKSPRYRRLAIDSLARYPAHDSVWSSGLESVVQSYRQFVTRTLDTLYTDSLRYGRALPDLLRRDLFYPHWRPQYDSVESAIVLRTLEVLRLVDSNARQIRFEDDLRFSDYDAAERYETLRKDLDSLAGEEQRINRSSR